MLVFAAVGEGEDWGEIRLDEPAIFSLCATIFRSVMAGLDPATQLPFPIVLHVRLGPRVKPGDDGREGGVRGPGFPPARE